MALETFDPKERAREKQLSRDQDERDLASGIKTREQLRRENGLFAFPDAKILWDECEQDLDPVERAKEKQLSRDQDGHDLASGIKTRAQLQRENVFLHPSEFRVRLDLCERLS